MKILFVEQFSEVGGGQRNLLDLLPAVVERGWKAVVAAPGSGALLEKTRAVGAETATIEFGRYSEGRKTAGDALQFAFDTARLRRWIAGADCDVISVGGARLLPGVAMGAREGRLFFRRSISWGMGGRWRWLGGRSGMLGLLWSRIHGMWRGSLRARALCTTALKRFRFRRGRGRGGLG